ncbi:hypothetical protein RFN28_32585 [Mesorhizobium sp. VK24D]|uniref:Uncharacterized protein n=1 Tax=Mesorhizobium album TaxID=3072314 RepID=A0ABU4Y887_9HYPH|nr:hypothetical protein [Mesorhizobium sp. VK24D]MDX8483154.1 hypothetical protein [Mesorhizobium sp. VK24D]
MKRGAIRYWTTEKERQDLHERSLENIRKRSRMERVRKLPAELAHLDLDDIPPGVGEKFDCRAEIRRRAQVEEIVAAVAAGIPVPKWLNRRRLRLKIDEAVRHYRAIAELEGRQSRDARKKLLERHLAWARKYDDLAAMAGDERKWLAEQLGSAYDPSAYDPPGETDLAKAVKAYGERLQRVRDTFWPEKQPESEKIPPGLESAPRSLNPGESSLDWLIRKLAHVFEHFFRMDARQGLGVSQWKRKDGTIGYGRLKETPCETFVLAVLKEAGIEVARATVRRALKGPARRKNTGAKRAKK